MGKQRSGLYAALPIMTLGLHECRRKSTKEPEVWFGSVNVLDAMGDPATKALSTTPTAFPPLVNYLLPVQFMASRMLFRGGIAA